MGQITGEDEVNWDKVFDPKLKKADTANTYATTTVDLTKKTVQLASPLKASKMVIGE